MVFTVDDVIRATRRADPFHTLAGARERDVDLVVIGDRAQCGTPSLMAAAGSTVSTADGGRRGPGE